MSFLSFVFMLFMAAPSQAAAPAPATGAPREVVVSSFSWGQPVRRTIVMPGSRPSVSQDPWDPRRPRGRRFGPPPPEFLVRESYVLVRNSGTRTVKSVSWSYVFYDSARREREVRRVRFQSKEKIAPGEMKFISEQVADPAPSAFGDVVIERVEFADGSAWQAPSATPGA
jgi:hypothetical protein